jgi:hypothetical protein
MKKESTWEQMCENAGLDRFVRALMQSPYCLPLIIMGIQTAVKNVNHMSTVQVEKLPKSED